MGPNACLLFAASAVIAIVVGGCALASSVAPPVTPAMISHAHGTSAETLNEGRRLFVGPCTACHAPDPIGKLTLPEWRAAVDKMAPRTKLNADRRAALLAFITAAKGASDLPAR